MTSNDIIINADWIDNETRLYNENEILQQEFMKTIQIVNVYINNSSEIVKVSKMSHTFKHDNNIILSNDIFKYYLQNRTIESIKYQLFKLLIYNIDLGEKHYTTIKSVSTINFLNCVSHVKDIVINPSLFIFHELNTIYFIYKSSIKNSKNVTHKNRKRTF